MEKASQTLRNVVKICIVMGALHTALHTLCLFIITVLLSSTAAFGQTRFLTALIRSRHPLTTIVKFNVLLIFYRVCYFYRENQFSKNMLNHMLQVLYQFSVSLYIICSYRLTIKDNFKHLLSIFNSRRRLSTDKKKFKKL